MGKLAQLQSSYSFWLRAAHLSGIPVERGCRSLKVRLDSSFSVRLWFVLHCDPPIGCDCRMAGSLTTLLVSVKITLA